MKKILGIILGLFLLVSSAYANHQYKIDELVPHVQKHGNVVALDPNRIVSYLEFHTADREKTHTSYYTSVFLFMIDKNVFVVQRVSFIKEIWNLNNDEWTVERFVINDNDLDGVTDQIICEVLKEKVDGIVLSIDTKKCEVTDNQIVEEIIGRVALKVQS